MAFRLPSPSPESTEVIVTAVIDSAVEVLLYYRERPLRTHRIDLVVEDVVLVELKAIDRLAAVHQAQVLSYLRASSLRLGLLMNFNCAWMKGHIRRIIL